MSFVLNFESKFYLGLNFLAIRPVRWLIFTIRGWGALLGDE